MELIWQHKKWFYQVIATFKNDRREMSEEAHLPFLHVLLLDPKKDNSERIRINHEVLIAKGTN